MIVDRPLVIDGAFPYPRALRMQVLAQPVQAVTIGDDTFRGIRLLPDVVLRDLTATFARLVPELQPTLMFARQSPQGQVEPNYVHSDADMGDVTGIVYLTLDPPTGDGTKFWEHVETRQQRGGWSAAMQASAKDPAQWDCWRTVAADFSRLLLFPSDYVHSRALPDNYGTGDDARLILVVFFTKYARRADEVFGDA